METGSKVHKPKTYNEAINNPVYRNKWQKVINKKLWNLNSYKTWTYISLPLKQKAINDKQIFKVKYYLVRSIKRYKEQLVSQSFFQVYEIDYIKIFALTIAPKLLRILLVIAIILRLIFLQITIIGVYLETFLGKTNT